MNFDYEYQNLIQDIFWHGEWSENRTGVRTLFKIGHYMKLDCSTHFPLLTTKRVFWKSAFGEMLGFIRGYTSAADFRKLGCRVWDKDANENVAWLNNPNRRGTDDLNRIYGVQWRGWRNEYFTVSPDKPNQYDLVDAPIDQFQNVVDSLNKDQDNRRLIVTAWNPAEMDEMALPPCHMTWMVGLTKNKTTIDLMLQIRSNDLFLGNPYNIAQYTFLLHIIARITNKKVGNLHYSGFNVHIYEPHIPLLKEQMDRLPKQKQPKIRFIGEAENLYGKEFQEFIETTMIPIGEWVTMDDYDPHPAIRGEMYTESAVNV